MLQDILRESWVYKDILQEGFEEGREQGVKQGIEKERQQELPRLRQPIITFVQGRFPELRDLARKQVEGITDPDVLHNLLIQMFSMQTTEEAKQLLLTFDSEGQKSE